MHIANNVKSRPAPGRDLTKELHRPVVQFAATDVVTLLDTQTVGEALERLRSRKLGEKIVYFYVVDAEQHLVGVMPVRRLLMSPLDEPLAAIMLMNVVALPDTATLQEASEMMLGKRLMALPIVDSGGHLVGVFDITYFSGELSDVAHQHEVESAFQLIGVHTALGREVSWWSSFRDRFSWLLANIIGGLICATIVAAHESLIGLATMLAFFIPIVLTITEAVSIQSMTLTLQTSSSAESWQLLVRAVRRELPAAFTLGVVSAAIVAIISYLWKGQWVVSAAVGIGITGAVILASALGVILPAAVRALKADPKIASGPIVLALADIIALILLFQTAKSLLG